MLTKDFLTAGKAIFTLEIPHDFANRNNTKPHYTWKVSKPKNPSSFLFVSLLTGPDNTNDYKYLGLLFPRNGIVNLTAKSNFDAKSWPVLLLHRICANLWGTNKIEASGFKLHHEGYCCKCGRLLTVPSSIESGIGPECGKKAVFYGAPVVTAMDIASNGGIYEDVYGGD
jgi:hypothetical protein